MLALTPRPPGILYTAATNEHQTAEYSVLERMINEQDCSLWRTFSKRPPGPEILQRRTFSLSLKSKILYLSQGLVFIQVPVRHADRLREPDSTTPWYLQIGPEVEKIR